MSFYDKLLPKDSHRLLACDGGGMRGLISIEVLAKVEKICAVSPESQPWSWLISLIS